MTDFTFLPKEVNQSDCFPETFFARKIKICFHINCSHINVTISMKAPSVCFRLLKTSHQFLSSFQYKFKRYNSARQIKQISDLNDHTSWWKANESKWIVMRDSHCELIGISEKCNSENLAKLIYSLNTIH